MHVSVDCLGDRCKERSPSASGAGKLEQLVAKSDGLHP
jgi:hypothetical protein